MYDVFLTTKRFNFTKHGLKKFKFVINVNLSW